MKDKALLAKYRIEATPVYKQIYAETGVEVDGYSIHINGNRCQVRVFQEKGGVVLRARLILPEEESRLPTYEECLQIKDVLFEENEMLVFGLSKNLFMNITDIDQFSMNIYEYDGRMPPIKEIMKIDDYKVDGNYKVKKGRRSWWNFIKITGDKYPSMDEIFNFKFKYANEIDVAIFLVKDAVIMFWNTKDGITFRRQTMK